MNIWTKFHSYLLLLNVSVIVSINAKGLYPNTFINYVYDFSTPYSENKLKWHK